MNEENHALLAKLQQKDIQSLIERHERLLELEWFLLILLAAILITLVMYYLWHYLHLKLIPPTRGRDLKSVLKIKDQKLFLKESGEYIREWLHLEEQGLTDLELFAFFHGTPLAARSEEALSLIDQGRYSQTPLTPSEREAVASFLRALAHD